MNKGSQMVSKEEHSIVKNVGCEGLYKKMCDHYGTEEVGMMKATIANNFSDAEFVQALYLAKANGLNPLKRQCYFYMANSKYGGRTIVFMVAIDGFRARAKAARIPLLEAKAVHEKDDFEWDAVAGIPSIHKAKASDRGRVIAGWGRIRAPWMEKPFSMFKDRDEWLEDTGSNFHTEMSSHMMEITIERNLYKVGAPDVLPGAHTPEEWGGRIIDGQLSMDPKAAADPPKDGDKITITKDEKLLLITDIRLFMDRLDIKRDDARWAKLEEVLDRKLLQKKMASIPDWDLTRIHSKLQDESQEAMGVKPAEVITPEQVPTNLETEKTDEESKPTEIIDPCQTCHAEIPKEWGETLTRFKSKIRECQPCYRTEHEEPVQVGEQNDSQESL